MNKIILFILFFSSACSSTHNSINAKHNFETPVVEIDGEKLVSVQVAMDLAFSAYLKSCVDTAHFYGNKGVFKTCSKQARIFVDELMHTFRFKRPLPKNEKVKSQ